MSIMNSDTINITPATMPLPVRASKCCGCCCDYRRAVIIVDIVIIVLEVFVMIFLATDTATYYFVLYQDEDIVKTEMIFSAISIIFGFCSIFGAYVFNIWPVLLSVVWLLVGYIAGIIVGVQWCNDFNKSSQTTYNNYGSYSDPYYGYSYGYYYYETCVISPGVAVVQAIIMALWMYPHVGFVVQVKKGTLRKDNYSAQSCCCVGNEQRVDQQYESNVVITQASPYENSKMDHGPAGV